MEILPMFTDDNIMDRQTDRQTDPPSPVGT